MVDWLLEIGVVKRVRVISNHPTIIQISTSWIYNVHINFYQGKITKPTGRDKTCLIRLIYFTHIHTPVKRNCDWGNCPHPFSFSSASLSISSEESIVGALGDFVCWCVSKGR